MSRDLPDASGESKGPGTRAVGHTADPPRDSLPHVRLTPLPPPRPELPQGTVSPSRVAAMEVGGQGGMAWQPRPAVTRPPSPGTCTNDRSDDCRKPDGTLAPTCWDMARDWLVPESSEEGCWAPTGLPPTASPRSPVPSLPSTTPCTPAPLCQLLLTQ